ATGAPSIEMANPVSLWARAAPPQASITGTVHSRGSIHFTRVITITSLSPVYDPLDFKRILQPASSTRLQQPLQRAQTLMREPVAFTLRKLIAQAYGRRRLCDLPDQPVDRLV